MAAATFMVAGKVQGVWFRAATREQALLLGLTGYARNLPDGRVQILAVGDEAGLELLQRWLWQGPPLAEVTAVAREPVTPEPETTKFNIS